MTSNQAPRRTLLWLSSVLLVLLTTVTTGCADREHIRDDHGEKVRRHFAMQRVHAAAATGSPSGLDSEESAVIQAGYRQRLAGDEDVPQSPASQVLILKDPQAKK